ncbi:hypothetical protein JAAARDRAFT_60839 [Jaapia argillacea MUCL 33604]|uniref:Anaphase-promoting complex subunit 4 WD40 domain-containing protein n=1 Tax=Jaapia argillacea MUCL 33604 TaxID=933084 RepID=A0A067PUN0_9AGAM|nr:hypothetical protein JAAARDRAFT_60839 [Jaapia argillacea MUCL 33604]
MDLERRDWCAVFNPAANSSLDIDLVHTLKHDSIVCCARFSLDGKYLATGSNHIAKIFAVETGVNVAYIWTIFDQGLYTVLYGHVDKVLAIDYSPDGCFPASGSIDETVKIWDVLHGGDITIALDNGPNPGVDDVGIFSLSFSPDGQSLATASSEGVVRLWDVASGTCIARLRGHGDCVHSVKFSADGLSLISGSADSTVRGWDISGVDRVMSVALSEDDKWLISGSKDGSVIIWDARTAQWVCLLQNHLGHSRWPSSR